MVNSEGLEQVFSVTVSHYTERATNWSRAKANVEAGLRRRHQGG